MSVAYGSDAQTLKQNAAAALAGTRTGDKNLDRKLDAAVDHINKSLTRDGSSLFYAGDQIAPKPDGDTVFTEERAALAGLQPLKNDRHVPAATLTVIANVESSLTTADRRIASVAIDVARPLATSANARAQLQVATDALARGDRFVSSKDHDHAIEQYQQAWEAAERSIGFSAPRPSATDLSPAPDSVVATSKPTLGATVESTLDLFPIDARSVRLSLDGHTIVDGSKSSSSSAIVIDRGGGRVRISIVPSAALAEGTHTLTVTAVEDTTGCDDGKDRNDHGKKNDDHGHDDHGHDDHGHDDHGRDDHGHHDHGHDDHSLSVTKTWSFVVDTRAPNITIVPATGTTLDSDTPTITVAYSDNAPGSGVATSTLSVSLDGSDVTGRFVVGSTSATWTVSAATPLAQGSHTVTARIRDRAGNEGTATSTFVVASTPTSLAIELPNTSLVAGTATDLTIRALTVHGQTARSFQGVVLVQTTDPRSPLNGLSLTFTAADQGAKTAPASAQFLTAGPQTITVTTAPGTLPSLQGSLSVVVTPAPAASLTFRKGGVSTRVLAGQAPPAFSAAVQDAFGNARGSDSATLVARIAAVGSTSVFDVPPSVDGTGVAIFAPSALAVGDYTVTVSSTTLPALSPLSFMMHVVAPPAGDLFVSLPTDPVPPGGTFTAHVFMNVSGQGSDPQDLSTVLGGYDVCLYHDPQRLVPASVGIVCSMGGFASVNTQHPGLVAVSDFNSSQDGTTVATVVQGFVELFSVTYTVNPTAPGGPTPIGAEVFGAISAARTAPAQTLGGPTPRPSFSGTGLVTVVGPPSTEFRPLAASPLEFTVGVDPNAQLAVHFTAAVSSTSLGAGLVLTRRADRAMLGGAYTLANEGYMAVFTPSNPLEARMPYDFTAGPNLLSTAGASLTRALAVSYAVGVTLGTLDANRAGRIDASTTNTLLLTKLGMIEASPNFAGDPTLSYVPSALIAAVTTSATPQRVTAATTLPLPLPDGLQLVGTVDPYVGPFAPSMPAIQITDGQGHLVNFTGSGPITVDFIASNGQHFSTATARGVGTSVYVDVPGPNQGVPDGTFSLSLTVGAGDINFWPTSKTIPVQNAGVYDGTSPIVTSFSAIRVNATQFQFVVGLSDVNGSGVSLLQIESETGTVIGGTVSLSPAVTGGVLTSPPITVSTDGRYLVVVWDQGGNQASSNRLAIATHPPALSVVGFPAATADQAQVNVLLGTGPGLSVTLQLVRDGSFLAASRIVNTAQPDNSSGGYNFSLTTDLPSDGLHTYAVNAIDSFGNASSVPISIIFDRIAPTAVVTHTPSVVTAPGTVVTVSYSFSDPKPGGTGVPSGVTSVVLHRRNPDGSEPLLRSRSAMGDGNDSYQDDVTGLPDGLYSYFVIVTDAVGNTARIDGQGSLLISTGPPQISFVPVGTYLTSTFQATITDLLPFTSAHLFINGADQSGLATVSATQVNGVNALVATVKLDQRFIDGPFDITVTAQDQGGHAASKSESYVLDRTPPALTLSQPAAGSRTNNGNVTISGTWSDATSGLNLSTAEIGVTNAATGQVTSYVPTTPTSSSFQRVVGLADGTYVITAIVRDLAGNIGTSTTTVTVDSTPPTVTLASLAALTNNAQPTIRGTLSDAGTGIDVSSIRLLVDGVDVTAQATITGSGSPGTSVSVAFTATSPLADGFHAVSFSGTDLVSNGSSASASFQTDATPPSSPGRPTAGPRPLEPTIVIRWLPSTDTGSGLANYVLEVSTDNFASIASTFTTTNTFEEIAAPTNETTRYRLRAVDRAGNQSAPVEVASCEVFCIESLNQLVTTTAQVQVRLASGAPVTNATVVEASTGSPLTEVSPGVYQSASITALAGQALHLTIAASVNGSPVTASSGSLLPAAVSTDFGLVVVGTPAATSTVVASGGAATFGPNLSAATVGEALTAGPPPATGDATATRASVGFWHTAADDGGPTVNVLMTPSLLCCRYIPVYYTLASDDAAAQAIQVDFSIDGGRTFSPTTAAPAGDGTTALASTPAGLRHVFVWDAATDLRAVGSSDVILRVSVVGETATGSTSLSYMNLFQVTGASPAPNAQAVAPGSSIQLTFNQNVTGDPANLASSLQVFNAETRQPIPFTATANANVVSIAPTSALPQNSWIQVVVLPTLLPVSDPGPFDQDPRQLGLQSYFTTFRTGGTDAAGPSVASSSPADGASGVPTTSAILLTFDRPLAGSTVTSSNFSVTTASGPIPFTVTLSPDGKTVTLAPSTGLPAGAVVTVAVNPAVTSSAGVAVGRFLAINFTVAANAVAPTVPTILSPTNSSVVPSQTVTVSGKADGVVTVSLVVNGLPTSLKTVSDSAGDWSITTFPLLDGPNTVQAFASRFDGTSSALSSPTTVTVNAGTVPPSTASITSHEVLAGPDPSGSTTSPDFVTLTFNGPANASFVLSAQSLTPTAGFNDHAEASVDPANGGGAPMPISFSARFYGAPGQFSFDGSGLARVNFRASDVDGEIYSLQPVDPSTLSPLAPAQTVLQKSPVAACGVTPAVGVEAEQAQIGVRGNIQKDSSQPSQIVTCGNRALRLEISPPEAAAGVFLQDAAQSQPGAFGGLGLTTDANGNAAFLIQAKPGTQPFQVLVIDASAVAFVGTGYVEVKLAESVVLHSENLVTGRSIMTLTTDQVSVNNGSFGGRVTLSIPMTCNDCPPPYGTADGHAPQTVSNPVALNNGQENEARLDLALPGRGAASLVFARTYRSNVAYDGVLGHGWSHNYEMRLVRQDPNTILWLTGTSRVETFARQADGSFRSPIGFFDKLLGSDPTYEIRTPHGLHFAFRALDSALAPGAISAIRDSDGNTLTFQYGTSGVSQDKLVRALDPFGHSFSYNYDSATGRLASVTDDTDPLLNRTVTFRYSSHGDLIKVTGPALTQTTARTPLIAENQQPEGRSEIYAYTAGYADESLNHKLVLVVAPNEAAGVSDSQLEDLSVLKPLARIENTWSLDPSSPNYGRVIAQRLGGTNFTGVAAGGTITFEYAPVTPAGVDPINDEVSVARVKDRAGNLTELFMNSGGQTVRAREYTNRNVRPKGTGIGQDPDFFETKHTFNADGLETSTTLPMGNQIVTVYDTTNPDRAGQGNVLSVTLIPDARGDSTGGMQPRVTTFTYEPVYNQVRTVVDPRGNDPTFMPQNGGPGGPDRFRSVRYFDYQQSLNLPALAAETGLDVTTLQSQLTTAGIGVPIGNVNNDSSDDAFMGGHVIKSVAPPVTLVPAQTRALAAYGATQTIFTLMVHNAAGEVTKTVDPEGNVHTFHYFPANDPDGDGITIAGNGDASETGWIAETHVDTVAAAGRDSGTNPTPTDLSSHVTYDVLGDVIATLDGRGILHKADYNVLGELVHAKAAADTSGAYLPRDRSLEALGYESHVIYDHNGNVVESRAGNQGERDGTGAFVAQNPFWSRKARFDILDDPITIIQEVTPVSDDRALSETTPGAIVVQLRYDPQQKLAYVIEPEGNVVAYTRDERELPFTITRGFGSIDAATTKVHYDLNGNTKYVISATKKNPTKHPEVPEGDVEIGKYDGFDRSKCFEDGETNCGSSVFDPAGNMVRHYRHGPDEESDPRLSEVQTLFDELGRPFETDAHVFGDAGATVPFAKTIPTITSAPNPGEQFATSIVDYDLLSRPIRSRDPELHESFADYDGASRLIHAVGPAFMDRARTRSVSNEVRLVYDGASNLIQRIETERSPLSTVPDETYFTDFVLDAVGRTVRVTDPIGLTARAYFDSRSNVIAATDAKSTAVIANDPIMAARGLAGPGGASTNGDGNVTRAFYDGISRCVRVESLLKTGGQGDGDPNLLLETSLDKSQIPSAIIARKTDYDRNSRVIARTDANGSVTGSHYDALDRCDVVTFADLTARITKFDGDGDAIRTIDPNGTIIQRTFDAASRLLRVDVVKKATNLAGTGQDVLGTTLQAFEYDGLSRMRQAIDDNGAATTLGVATSFTFDSLSRRLTERHQINAQVAANSVSTTYGRLTVSPTAGTIDRTVTSGYRPEDSTLAYNGGADPLDSARVFGRRTSVTYSTGRQLLFGVDGNDRTQLITDSTDTAHPVVGYEFVGGRAKQASYKNGVETAFSFDGDRRLNAITHKKASSLVAGFEYDFDRSNNRTFERALHHSGATDFYTYDSLSRVTGVSFGVPQGGGAAAHTAGYVFDAVDNFVSRTEDGAVTKFNARANGVYAPDALNRVTKFESFDPQGVLLSAAAPVHDAQGARIKDAKRRLFFDAFERLVAVDRSFDGGATWSRAGTYTYDAGGRRVTRDASVYDESGNLLRREQVAYVCDGPREVEEVSLGTNVVVADYVFGGLDVDEVAQLRRGSGEYYLHGNSMLSTAAVTDAAGSVVERYEYPSIYGRTQVEDLSGLAKPPASEIGNPYRFQGRRFDDESGLYCFRNRYLDPEEGRFVNRDPIGIWGDAQNMGNGYAFCGGDPVNRCDPFGLEEFHSGDYYTTLAKYNDIRDEIGAELGKFWGPNESRLNSLLRRQKIVGETLNTIAANDKWKGEHGDPTVVDVSGAVAEPEGPTLKEKATEIAKDLIVIGGRKPIQASQTLDPRRRAGEATGGALDWVKSASLDTVIMLLGPKLLEWIKELKIVKRIFPNKLINMLEGELIMADFYGVKSIKVGAKGWAKALRTAITKSEDGWVKWAISEEGYLFIIPKSIGNQEFKHSICVEGKSVIAAGEARIEFTGGEWVGKMINRVTGHYETSEESLKIGVEAFRRAGIEFSGDAINWSATR